MMSMSDVQRLDAWKAAWAALRAHPGRWAFGWGPETFRAVYRLHRTQQSADMIGAMRVADHVHNLPLELLVTIGVVGTAAFISLAWSIWENTDTEGRAAMLGLLVMAMVEPVFFPPAALLALVVGAHQQTLRFKFRPWGGYATGAAFLFVGISLGVWINDATTPARSLVLHPHESEANQLAVMAALSHGELPLAEVYAHRAALADPTYREVVAQAAQLATAVKARPASR